MSSYADLAGKAALVTGGERGIGQAIARRLLGCGMHVLIAGVDEDSARATLTDLQADHGERVRFRRTDVGEEADVAAAVAEAKEAYGGLHGLVNNAARAGAHFSDPAKLPLETWQETLRVNLTGAFLCAKHALPHLRADGGAIVNIASTRALQSEPHGEPYAASKGGILALTHALAISAGPRVRVNAIAPGWIENDPSAHHDAKHHEQHPVGRIGRPGDIAALAAFLLSGEASGFITGQTHVCDGGMTRRMVYE
jgi:NAD(P)-dependent dehydrogenase (short-subunit alcohol dehydrogenase family)